MEKQRKRARPLPELILSPRATDPPMEDYDSLPEPSLRTLEIMTEIPGIHMMDFVDTDSTNLTDPVNSKPALASSR